MTSSTNLQVIINAALIIIFSNQAGRSQDDSAPTQLYKQACAYKKPNTIYTKILIITKIKY